MGPQLIDPNENGNGKETENTWDKRIKEAEVRAKKRAEEYAREQEQYFRELEEIGDTNEDLDTQKTGRFSGFLSTVDPARAYLFPLQQYLRIACIWLRVLTNVIVWEECYISFWIAVMSFILSAVVFFVPWGFLLQWTLRIIAWVAFGPWMKLVDKFYYSRQDTDEQKRERVNERQKRLDEQKLEAQIARERASKLRDFKQYMFGEHICRVNILKKDRYYDLPLPSSSATLYNPKSKSLGELAMQEAGYHRNRVNGQQLVGRMIPTVS